MHEKFHLLRLQSCAIWKFYHKATPFLPEEGRAFLQTPVPVNDVAILALVKKRADAKDVPVKMSSRTWLGASATGGMLQCRAIQNQGMRGETTNWPSDTG